MSFPAWQPWGYDLGTLRVVEDEQPALPLPQRSQHRPSQCVERRWTAHAAKVRRQLRELAIDHPRILGADPPDDLVLSTPAMRVLDRDLGLPHPAHTAERLNASTPPHSHCILDAAEQCFSAGERRVACGGIPAHTP
jgi:hypothetical protein